MTLDDWLNTIPEDERDTLTITEIWKAGATAMLEALIDRGYIGMDYEALARHEVQDIIGE